MTSAAVSTTRSNSTSAVSSGDANGPFRPVSLGGTCGTVAQVANTEPLLGMVLAPVLADPTVCKDILG